MDPISLMLGLGGIGASMFGQSQTNKMQQQMMAQQQSFQERMSSTAYQRASQDMTAAGLNPMMMFSNGSAASSPMGAAPSPNVKSGLDSDAVQKNIATAVQSRVANATIDNLVEQNAKIKAETLTEKERPLLVSREADLRGVDWVKRNQEYMTERERTGTQEAEKRISRNTALTADNQRAIEATVRRLLDQGGFTGQKADQIISPITNAVSSAVGVKRVMPRVEERTSTRRTDYDRDGQTTTFSERFKGDR